MISSVQPDEFGNFESRVHTVVDCGTRGKSQGYWGCYQGTNRAHANTVLGKNIHALLHPTGALKSVRQEEQA